MVWRQAGPPGSVMMGPITLTSWARQATLTRSAWFISTISAPPLTSASSKLYTSSMRRGASGQPGLRRSSMPRDLYQTFHSSNDSMMRLAECLRAATLSATATISLMNVSVTSMLPRNSSVESCLFSK